MRPNPFGVVREFEAALCEYTGAPYAVTTTSCTMALLLAVAWHLRGRVRGFSQHPAQPPGAAIYQSVAPQIEIPKRTYVGVPMSIIHAGGWPTFRDEDWCGAYQLRPLEVWDCARRFTAGMAHPVIRSRVMYCVSFHHAKILGDTQGGAILLDDPQADDWLRQARFDGRREGIAPRDQLSWILGWHCYMSPDVAARLLLKLSKLPVHNADLPNDDYPDLSQMEVFK